MYGCNIVMCLRNIWSDKNCRQKWPFLVWFVKKASRADKFNSDDIITP